MYRKRCDLSEELLPEQERVLGPDHPAVLTARYHIASLTAEWANADEGLRLFEALLPDQERLLGPDHPEAVITRQWIDRLTSR